jgi:hypothetical protein
VLRVLKGLSGHYLLQCFQTWQRLWNVHQNQKISTLNVSALVS